MPNDVRPVGIYIGDEGHNKVVNDTDGSQLVIPFSRITEYAETGTGLTETEAKALLQAYCRQDVEFDNQLTERWKRMDSSL